MNTAANNPSDPSRPIALIGISFIFLIGFTGAAHILGSIFDENIEPASRAVVQINTTPEQQIITLNGSYAFDVPAGTYRLLAVGQNASAEKNITILTDGDFRIDLILLPGVPAEDSVLTDLLSAPEVETPETAPDNGFDPTGVVIAALLVALGAGAYLKWKRVNTSDIGGNPTRTTEKANTTKPAPISTTVSPNRVLTGDQQKVMQTLASFNNRASQKELRKTLDHWSEAKVSMELTELEEMGAIQKLKKGRGNIIRKA
ncbi:hypothetical protein HY994_02960 [Candidatus Micrarchaeota archaeon]|nr:hypothetical protein [Candidatus Micrarchaeota archaeon]